MSTRRPRIKAAANLMGCKRKVKIEKPEAVEKTENIASFQQLDKNETIDGLNHNNALPKVPENVCEEKEEIQKDSFKCPKNVSYNRSASAIDEVFNSDVEENVIQQDLQKSASGFPMSPTKSRQRIRPTPIFGQRRNSFVANSPSPHAEDENNCTRKERHSSTSMSSSGSSQNNNLSMVVHKYPPSIGSVGRIRTESGCSTYSDSCSKDYSGKSRKPTFDEQRALTKKEFHSRFNGNIPDKSMLKMFDLIYYNPATNPMEQTNSFQAINSKNNSISSPTEKLHDSVEKTTVAPVPQLKIGLNGELIIDEKSLVIETTAESEARKTLANTNLIYLDENTGNNGFYKRQKRTKDWSADETIKFYRCLQTVGTDFSLMLTLFPNRNRRDLKLKFKKEEKSNLNLIDKALLYPKTFNIDELKTQLETEEKIRAETERRWKEIKEQQTTNLKKTALISHKTSRAVRVLSNGETIYEYENIPKNKFSKRANKKEARNKTIDKSAKKNNKVINVLKKISKIKKGHFREIASNSDSVKNIESNSIDVSETCNSHSDIEVTDACPTEKFNIDTLLSEMLEENNANTNQSTVSEENETDIKKILSEIGDGSLVFVSSVDPNNSEKSINEIFRINKSSGLIFDKPLELPDEILQSVLSIIS